MVNHHSYLLFGGDLGLLGFFFLFHHAPSYSIHLNVKTLNPKLQSSTCSCPPLPLAYVPDPRAVTYQVKQLPE